MSSSQDTILVTGASRGLGLAIVKELLSHGYRVVGVARNKGSEIDDLVKLYNEHFFFEHFDLNNTAGIKTFTVHLANTYGRLYGLVNNAGIGTDGVLATMHEKDISSIYNVNLVAPTLLCKYLSRGMLVNRRGCIVNIASIIATTGFSGLSVYGASKAGLLGLTKSLSRELGKAGIRVNCISPGYLETAMSAGIGEDRLDSIRRRSPFGRFPTIEEVAKTVSFLVAPEGSGIHGANLVVDLGSTA